MALELDVAGFDSEVVKYDGVALVDFWAPWCGPCKMIAPVLDELSKEYEGKAKICKVNIDNHGQIASKFGITSIPTLLVFKKGSVVSQVIGLVSKAELAKKLDSAIL